MFIENQYLQPYNKLRVGIVSNYHFRVLALNY